jgi:Transposase DDE domain group 1
MRSAPELAVAEPKRLRYRILHTAARVVRGQRRRWLHIPSTWPWATQISAAFTRIAAIPPPAHPAQPYTYDRRTQETTPTAATDRPSPRPANPDPSTRTISEAGQTRQTPDMNHRG